MMQAWRTLAECPCRRAEVRFAAQLLQRAGMAGEGDEYRDPARDTMFLEVRHFLRSAQGNVLADAEADIAMSFIIK